MSLPKPLPGLLPAAFRGIGFYVTDASSEAGRRIAAHYFPGLDIAAYDDLGKTPEKFSLSGFYVGDDYIAHGKALKSAFEQSDPGTLMHPWWGVIRAVIVEAATVSFSAAELRLVRFEARFEKAEDNILAKLFGKIGLGSLPKLLSKAAQLAAQGQFMLSLVSKNTLSQLLSDAAQRAGGRLFAAVRELKGAPGTLLSSLLPAALPASALHYGGLAANIGAVLADAAVDAAFDSAIAPAADFTAPKPPLAAADAFNAGIVLAAALTSAAHDAPSSVDRALLAAAGGQILSAAGQLCADIEPASRAAALALRGQISAALDDYSNGLQTLFEDGLAEGASRLYRAAAELKLAVVEDINETIGRLPATVIIALEKEADAWAIAHMLYGDKPQELEAHYQDLLARNNLRHPALIPGGRLEVMP